ncbi:MAG: CoA pyrophosphatase, partial [Rhizomicrobium sp.]
MSDESPAAIGHRIVSGGVELLRSRLLRDPPDLPLTPKRSDYDLNPQSRPIEKIDLKPAAVLLPLVFRHEPHVLLTQRTHHLTRHAGQVAFPGGRADPGDISLVETALRETQEETGIEPAYVTIAGFLDAHETGTGYAILPVVGLLSEGFALSPHAAEVAEIFEVPLSFLLDPVNKKTQSR